MDTYRLASRIPLLPVLIIFSLVIGFCIPAFYVWTDSDQSRPSPLLWKVPLGLSIVSVGFCVALPWLPIASHRNSDDPRPKLRYSLKTLLMLTTAIAITIPLLFNVPMVISAGCCVASYAYLIAFCVRNPVHRLAGATLVGCMVLPYAWVIRYEEFERILPFIATMIAGMPSFVPAVLLSQVIGQNFHDANWLMFLLSSMEIAFGVWVMSLGPKRTIAYLMLVTQISAFGSLAFHMLCLA